jgi:hypothetical protein
MFHKKHTALKVFFQGLPNGVQGRYDEIDFVGREW